MNKNQSAQMILCADPKAQYVAHSEEIGKAIQGVLDSGWYILGDEVRLFESEFAGFVGVRHCIGVANGTDALALALRACGVRVGDEVITVSHSAVATVAAIEQIGATPVLCDIEPESRCLNPDLLPGLMTEKTKAVIPVHIYGHPANIEAICDFARKNNLMVVEDCAQAHGARRGNRMVGSFGNVAAFSFYPTKNLGAIGDGGGIVTDNDEIAENAKILRQYGWKERYVSSVAGLNSRLDEMQAAILRVKLRYLERDNIRRNEIADMYDREFLGTSLGLPHRSTGVTHAMHLYVVEHDSRDDLRTYLLSKGIQAAVHYPLAIQQQPAYSSRSIRGADKLPVTESVYKRIVSLPMYPELSDDDVRRVIMGVKSWLEGGE
jgi:dTDP-4-amino-4,6-dideoxygalactose transaminase